MRLVVVYRAASDHRMYVESYIRDFKFQTGGEIEIVSPETREGATFMTSYNIRRCWRLLMMVFRWRLGGACCRLYLTRASIKEENNGKRTEKTT
jgi:hypothetical protein